MRRFPRWFAWLLLISACGAGSPTGSEPKTASDGGGAHHDRDSDSADASDNESSEASATPEKSKGPSCDDGTCSLCGNGICPTGWYCDEKASACSWLAECAEKPSCGCVTRVLGSSCKCKDDSGALKVACD